MICNRPWQAFDDHIRNVCPTHLRRGIYLPKLKQAYLAWIRRPSHESIHPSFYELCLFPSLSTYLYTRLDNHQNSLLQEVGMEREGRGGGGVGGGGCWCFLSKYLKNYRVYRALLLTTVCHVGQLLILKMPLGESARAAF